MISRTAPELNTPDSKRIVLQRLVRRFFLRNVPHRTKSGNTWCLPAGLAFFIGGTWDTGNGYAWTPPLWRMVGRYYAEEWHQAGYTLWSWIFQTPPPKRYVPRHGLWVLPNTEGQATAKPLPAPDGSVAELPIRRNRMKYDWIEIAMENGGVLTTSRNVHGIAATMNWRGADPIRGDHHTTLPDALTSLNEALLDDAADECCPPPKPIQYTGHVPCQKCGNTHWMHGPCPQNTKSSRGTAQP